MVNPIRYRKRVREVRIKLRDRGVSVEDRKRIIRRAYVGKGRFWQGPTYINSNLEKPLYKMYGGENLAQHLMEELENYC